jgi:D-alanyl-lipoteichoic acid acyltransferase DltB (MBOAT superfamily)
MSWRDWGVLGTAVALLVTFLVSGIWHGASWGFVVWGGLHGVYLASSVYYKPWQKKIHKALGIGTSPLLKVWQTMVTFNLICLAWIFFRANSLSDSIYVVHHLFDGFGMGGVRSLLFSQATTELLVMVIFLTIPLIVKVVTVLDKRANIPFCYPKIIRWSIYCLIVFSLMLFSVDSNRAFIYFQF